jgi:tetratricopeptide (TPR) repeat protein
MERAVGHAARLVPHDAYLRLTLSSLGVGKMKRQILEKGLEKHPQTPQLYMLLGYSSFLQSDPDIRKQGEEQIRKAFGMTESKEVLRKETANAYHNVGTYYQKSKHYEEALGLFRKALDLQPDYQLAFYNLGNPYINLGILRYSQSRYHHAASAFEAAVPLFPEDSQAHLGLAQAYEKSGRSLEAIGAYRQTLSLDPKNIIARKRLKLLSDD